MYYIYILQSSATGKHYVGYTEQPERRLVEHNSSDKVTYTSKYRPWKMVALFECGEEIGIAIKVERFMKRQKSKTLLERMINGEALSGFLALLPACHLLA